MSALVSTSPFSSPFEAEGWGGERAIIEGLVDSYVSQIQILAVKAEAGALVEERVRKVVQEAASRFASVESGEPPGSLEAFAGRLGAGITRQGHSIYRRTLNLASELARENAEHSFEESRTVTAIKRI